MYLKLVSEVEYHDISLKLSNILNAPVSKVISRQKTNRKVYLISAENFTADEIFIIMSSVAHPTSINDELMELLFLVNLCQAKSRSKLSVGTAAFL